MADIDYNKMQEAFERALKARGGGSSFTSGPSTPTSSTTPGAGVLGTATGAVTKGLGEVASSGLALGKSFGDIAGKLVTGGVRISDVTKSLEQNFNAAGYSGSALGKALGIASGAIGEVVKYVEEGVDAFRELSKTGAGFNNSIIELRSSAAQTRMTLAEYGQVVKENSQLFTTFGGTVSQGAKQFTDFSKKFFDSPVADELRLMGFNTKDINELLALQTTTMRINQKLDAEATKREIEAARSLAIEMDAVSKLTGISRKEQEEKLRKDRENGQMMAAIDLAMMKGGKDVQKAFDGMTTAASMGGKDFQRLQQEIFAMGRPSEEMAAKFAMIGGDAQKLMTQAAEAARKGQTEQAKLLTQQAASAAANASGSETFMNLAAQGSKDFGDLSIQLRKNKVQLEEIAQREKLDLNTAEGLAKANELRMKMAKDEQQADKDNIAKSAILAEARAKDTYTAINNALVTPLQEKVNPALKGFADKLKEINTTPGGFRGTAEDKIKGAIAPVADAVRAGQERRTPGPGPTPAQPLTQEQQAAADAARQTGSSYRQGREAAGRPMSPVGGENVPQRNEGSLGATGKIFENWGKGTLVELHGMESVMRPEDLEKIVGASIKSATSGMGEVMNRTKSQGLDISKISRDISTSISSGSTTTRQVQSNESKKFQEQRTALEEELRNYKQTAIKEMQEKMGPGASPLKARMALKDDDIFKNTVEEAEKQLQILEKKIADGITFEVETKQEALEESKKLVQKELSIVQNTKSKILETQTDAANEEILSAKALTEEQKKLISESITKTVPVENAMKSSPTGTPVTEAEQVIKATQVPTIDLNALNLPGFGPMIKAAAATVPAEMKKPPATEEAKPAAQVKKQEEAKKEEQASVAAKKTATLDDVVKELAMLNSKIASLTEETKQIGAKQERATRASSQNIYQR